MKGYLSTNKNSIKWGVISLDLFILCIASGYYRRVICMESQFSVQSNPINFNLDLNGKLHIRGVEKFKINKKSRI